MNRNLTTLVIILALSLSLTACSTSEAARTTVASAIDSPATPETEPPAAGISDETATITEENKALIYSTLQSIYHVQPGSAGCSLRTMIAAGKLLDLAETLTDQIDASELTCTAFLWAQENDRIEGAFDDAYPAVRETAFDYLRDPESYSELLYECGYTFTHETHSLAYLEYVCNYIEISRATGE